MGVKNIIFFVLLQLVFISCEEEYYISSSEIESKLVVNALFQNDQPWHIEISKSYSILHDPSNDNQIEDAVVKMYDGDSNFLYDLEHIGKGIYTHKDNMPELGKYYTLTVEKDGFDKLQATGYCPEVANVVIGETKEIYSEAGTGVQLDFEIIQSDASDNFYLWEVKENKKDTNFIEGVSLININKYPDLLFNKVNSLSFDASIFNLKTLTIDSKFYQIGSPNDDVSGYGQAQAGHGEINKLDISNNNVVVDTGLPMYGNGTSGNTSGTNTERPNKFKLQLVTLSRDLYLHTLSLSEHMNESSYSTSSSQSTVIHSNIKGGLGVFAGINQQSIAFK